jgi:prepilin-type N-terminal cleavage/methylation domain-containing protein
LICSPFYNIFVPVAHVEEMAMLGSQKGYTLVELMVAISIVGVLSSTVMVAEQKFMNAGKPEALRIEYKTIATAAQAYLNDHNKFPSSDDELAAEGYIDSVPTLADYTIDSRGKITQIPR